MKQISLSLPILVFSFFVCSCSISENKTSDEQIYGQKPPGNIPEAFETNFAFIESDNPEFFNFSPDFNEFIYTIKESAINEQTIYYTRQVKGHWS